MATKENIMPTNTIIYFWEQSLDQYRPLLGDTVKIFIEQTVIKLKKLEATETKTQ